MPTKPKPAVVGESLPSYDSRTRPGPRYLYPWDTWLDGKSNWRITKGKQFRCARRSMIVIVRRMAAKRGVSISLYREGEDSLVIVNQGANSRAKTRQKK